jgi:hypothetical protein
VILPAQYKIRWIKGNSTSYFIGADHIYGGDAKIFEWDGSAENYTREYGMQSDVVFSCVVKNDIPYVFTRNGKLLRYNGGGFTEVARLPIAHTYYDLSTRTYNTNLNDGTSFNVMPNGMDIIDGNVHILLNGALNNGTVNYLDSMFSGIYEYDESIGLYNKYNLSRYVSGARIDFGGGSILKAGGLKNLNDRNFFAGFSTYTDISTTERHVIATINTLYDNRGYLITPKIQVPGELQKWQRLWIKHRLKNSGNTTIPNKLIVKYRTAESILSNFKAPVTWVDTTSFTSISGISNCVGEGDWSTASIGDEITIMRGHGAGVIAHIVSITNNAGTYTIVIDETLESAATTTANLYVRNWKKLGEVTHTSDTPIDFALYDTSSWIQFKVELRGLYDGCELEELQVISEPHNNNLS